MTPERGNPKILVAFFIPYFFDWKWGCMKMMALEVMMGENNKSAEMEYGEQESQ